MHTACERKFITESCLKLYEIMATTDEVLDYLESYVPNPIPFKRTKLGE